MIHGYCERGASPELFSEPANVASSLAFLLAATMAIRAARHRGAVKSWPVGMFAAIAAAIGLGSAWFHAYPTLLSRLGDVGPITTFVVCYLAWSLRVLMASSWATVIGVLLATGVASAVAAQTTCPAVIMAPPGSAAPCLNGSVAYLSVLAALLGLTIVTAVRASPAAPRLASAAVCFAIALCARTFDFELCDKTNSIGVHWLWHLFAALTVYILLRIMIDHEVGTSAARREGDRT